MKETAFDVLIYLFENYMDTEQSLDDWNVLEDELYAAGFPADEVDKALYWLDSLTTFEESQFKHAACDSSMRIYSSEECEVLPIECRGFLYYLEQTGVLSHQLRERVIDRFLALDSDTTSLQRLKWVVMMVLFNHPSSEAVYSWMQDLVYNKQPKVLH